MRIPRIHHDGPLAEGMQLTLEEAPSVHAARAVTAPGAALCLFNGRGGEFDALIDGAERGRTRVRVGAHRPHDSESPLPITLAQGISRGERMDITLQKAVELGAARIVPLVTSYCQVRLEGERLERRHRHWLGIIIAACEQCGRTRLPELLPAMPLAEWLATAATADDLRIVLDHRAQRSFAQLEAAPRALTLLAGPEGGLEDTEIAAAERAGYLGLRLGPRVLRTETAGLVALTAMQLRWGDLS